MCSILTDAPLKTISHKPFDSNCGECKICENICSIKALKGKTWEPGISRDEIVDVFLCNTRFQCPWTQKYMNESESTYHWFVTTPLYYIKISIVPASASFAHARNEVR